MSQLDLGTLDQTCEVCAGSGSVASPDWEAWNRRYDESLVRSIKAGRPEQDGYDLAYTEAGEQPLGLPCPECSGIGRRPTRLGLEILGFLRRYS